MANGRKTAKQLIAERKKRLGRSKPQSSTKPKSGSASSLYEQMLYRGTGKLWNK